MPKKRKGKKASKFARMSDEERIRYLQHRAELELETKLRKQQLIIIYAKNKLKHEEDFARINTAKLNEQWRVILRKLKCAKLKDNIEYLWSNFKEILSLKDDFIKKLLDGLLKVNVDHKRFQDSHMMILDNIIEKGQERVNYLLNSYNKCIKIIEHMDKEDLYNRKKNINDYLMHLKSIIFAKNKCQEKEVETIKTNHAINIHTILYDKNDSILKLKGNIHPILEHLWKQLNDIITNYENSTGNVQKQYQYLKKYHDLHQIERKNFPIFYAQLKTKIETIKKKLATLVQEREESIEDLKLQSELLTKRVFKLRQEIKMAQSIDAIQLKQLSVVSNEVIKDLQQISDKSIELQTISKLCFNIKVDSLNMKQYSIENLNDDKQLTKLHDEFFGFFKKIESFRDQLHKVQEENNFIKQERNNVIEENNRLKDRLRSYLRSLSKIPTISEIKVL